MALSCSFPSEKTKELQQLIVLNSPHTNSDKTLPSLSSQNNRNTKGWSSVPTLPTTSPISRKEEEWTSRSTGTGNRTQVVISGDQHKNDQDEDLLINKSEGTYLPDVTEIDSPIRVSSHELHIFSIENPCDLLAQLKQQSEKSSNKGLVVSPTTMAMPRPTVMGAESSSIVKKDEATADEQAAGGITTTPTPSPTNICTQTSTCVEATGESLAISFDDNGNPCHFQCHKSNVVPVPDCHHEKSPSDNNAAVPEDETADSQQDNQNSSPVNTSVTKEIEITQQRPGFYEIKKTQVEEPKYFINAAALSEENFPLSPTIHFSSLDYQQYIDTETKKDEENSSTPEYKKSVVTQEKQNNSYRPSMKSKISSDTLNDIKDGESIFCRPRVPVSKSFPDIVQTTFSNDLDLDVKCKDPPTMIMNNLTKDSSEPESLVADSLEELAMASLESQTNNQHQTHNFLTKDSSHSRTVPAALELLTESQQGGILAEKPPEAWVIDFNSLSLESEMESSDNTSHSQTRRSNSGSNPNSLAFFVNIDDDEDDDTTLSSKSNKEGRSQESCDKGTGTESIDKKIFSMFVDFRSNTNMSSCNSKDSKGEDSSCGGGPHHQPHIHQPLSHPKNPIINKTVMNVLEDHGRSALGSSSSARNKFPSPIFQHKAAAESARKAARLELEEKAKAGKIDILTATEQNILSSSSNVTGDNSSSKGMDESANSNRSSLHVANHIESSFSSSLLSSMENSQPTEMEICQGGPCFKLGKDLLRMFQDGINTDVNISVNGRYVKAHKCILASRSQYFAAILSGHWVEKAGNTINLDGFSYNVVQFTMYHIYSGTNEIPDSIDLLELATLTDLLGLEGLRENISQTIRVKFCHNFHRPCTGCISGVLECFPIALAYGMDELNRKMTKWICKHFVRIWPTKAFANLGDELIEKCLRYSVNHLSGDNILDHTLGCDQLLTTMPTVRWTECIFSVVSQLSEACTQFIGENFCQVLQSQRFLLFGKGQTWNISRIEGTFTEAMLLLKPDEACLSHTALCRLIELGTETIDEVEWSTMFVDFLKLLRHDIERYLMANASKAVLSKNWEQLSQDVRKRICTSSFMGFDKYGNKITKNTSSNSTTGLSTVGQSKSGGHRERPSSTSSVSRGGGAGASKSKAKPLPYSSLPPGLSTKDKDSDSSISHSPNVGSHNTLASTNTNSNKTKTKVASVRPMQNVYSTSTLPKNTSEVSSLPSNANVNSKLSTAKASTLNVAAKHSYNSASPRSSLQKQSSVGTVSHLRNSVQPERERSFSNSLRNSNAPSANRTPLKPLTPMTPSKPSPLTANFPSKNARSSVRHHPVSQTSASTAPPQKTFMNNSARAAAVSKPILKPASSRTSSSSSSVQHTPRAPNLTQPSRYASNLSTTTTNRCGSAGSGGYSARSSFSSSERPERVTTLSKAKSVTNNATTAGRHTTKKSTGFSQGHTTIPSLTKNLYGTSKSGVGGSASATKLASGTSALQSLPSTTNTKTSYLVGGGDVFSKDNVMSRSTIETDSGETKIRTLAEIGRSSTFSKDEPTILGKMDGSTYDVGISP